MNPQKAMRYIEMVRTKKGWHWRIKAYNGEIMAASEVYSSKRKAEKTAISIYSDLSRGTFRMYEFREIDER